MKSPLTMKLDSNLAPSWEDVIFTPDVYSIYWDGVVIQSGTEEQMTFGLKVWRNRIKKLTRKIRKEL